MVAPFNRLKDLGHPFFGGLFDELDREFGGLIGDAFSRVDRVLGMVGPGMNVAGDENRVVVTMEVPGVNPSDLDIDIQGRVLVISGKRVALAEADEVESWIVKSRPDGDFQRRVQLPFDIEEDAVKATYKLGVLRIELPRREASKPKKIVIEG